MQGETDPASNLRYFLNRVLTQELDRRWTKSARRGALRQLQTIAPKMLCRIIPGSLQSHFHINMTCWTQDLKVGYFVEVRD